jgi:predicted methyltransferase
MNFRKSVAALSLAAVAAFSVASFAANDKKDVKGIEAAASGSWRSNDEKARDAYRHPVEALSFWGLKPGMTILEVQPGGGWWTNILAPYARTTHGEFYATAPNVSNPGASDGAKKAREGYINKFSDASIYGKVNLVDWGKNAAPLPANKFDFVLVAREIHNWIHGGTADADLANIFAATKPGGILAIEEHRAKATQDPSTYNGYVPEAYMIQIAEKAGFKLAGKSEIMANAKDTADHPFGVWTLPPVRQSSEGGKPVDASFDRAKYDAIGESDRMTLKFVKPAKK